MKYINVYQTDADFNTAKSGLAKPQLSYVKESGIIHCYNTDSENPVELVDMGLSTDVKWAKYNVGATGGSTKESWYGDYYAWGEIETKTDYGWGTYKFGDEDNISKYNDDDVKLELENIDNVAYVKQQLSMPAEEDFEDLYDNCTVIYKTDYNGVSGLNGLEFVSNINQNVLFFPMGGYMDATDLRDEGNTGYMWLKIRESVTKAQYCKVYDDGFDYRDMRRIEGLNVRGLKHVAQ